MQHIKYFLEILGYLALGFLLLYYLLKVIGHGHKIKFHNKSDKFLFMYSILIWPISCLLLLIFLIIDRKNFFIYHYKQFIKWFKIITRVP